MSQNKNQNRSQLINFTRMCGSLMLDLSVGLIIGGSIGYYIDGIFGIYPICMVVLGFFGFLGGVANIFKNSKKL